MSLDLSGLIAEIRSSDPATQGSALREAARVSRTLASEAVHALTTSSARVAVADEIACFGSVVPLLENLLTQEVDAEAKAFAATLLLQFGSKAGVDYLLGALRREEGPTLHIAIWLAKAGIPEASEMLTGWLRRWDFKSDPYGATSLTNALRRLGAKLPDDVRLRVEVDTVDPTGLPCSKTGEPKGRRNLVIHERTP